MKRGRQHDGVLSIDEQTQLQHTAVLINSSLFKLQVEQLLGEVDNEKIYSNSGVNKWIEEFTSNLRSVSANAIAEGKIPKVLTNQWLKSSGSLQARAVTSQSVPFSAITDIQCVGSFANHTITHPITNIDIAFVIPDTSLPNS